MMGGQKSEGMVRRTCEQQIKNEDVRSKIDFVGINHLRVMKMKRIKRAIVFCRKHSMKVQRAEKEDDEKKSILHSIAESRTLIWVSSNRPSKTRKACERCRVEIS